MIEEEWFDNGQGFLGPEPYGNISPSTLEARGVKLNMLLLDYHWNYWRLRNRIAELEGKVYELEETANGRLISTDDGNDHLF